MPWLLERRLKNLANRSNPDPAFSRALQKTLRSQTGHPGWWVQGWKYAVVGTSVVTLACSATGVYAYTSDDVLPDTPLYPVRQGIEKVEQATAITPEQKATVQIKLLTRRLHEQEVIAIKQKPVAQAKLQNLETNLQKVEDAAASLPTSTQATIDEKVVNLEEQHAKTLLKDQSNAKTPEQKQRVDDLLSKQREAVQKMIDSLQADRRARFTNLLQNRLDDLHLRLNRLNQQIDGAGTRREASYDK